MKKNLLFFVILMFIANIGAAKTTSFADEELNYVVTYKWGLIHKDAGTASLSLKNEGNIYKIMLIGRTKPWADKFYEVRDTLIGTVRKAGLKPLSYTKIAHEDGKFSRDDILYSYSGANVTGKAHRFKINKKGEKSESNKTLLASGRVYDMISVFYFLRTLDYDKLSSDTDESAMLFSGSKVESLSIRCVGKEIVKMRDKSEKEAYHIKFRFTTEGKTKSSDDIDTWISTSPQHIPLLVIGKLPIGQVKCYYVN